jgi:spore coat protein H
MPTADDLFDPSVVHDIYLTVSWRDFQELRDRYREDTYYPADLRWRDQEVRNVGIRSRGLGSRSPVKPGLRVDFDRYSMSQEFLGLKSLVLDNLTQDASMIKERVTMLMFGEMGIPAPREVHARVFINNEYLGLYAIVESVDKKFLKRHFNENDGYLHEFKPAGAYGFEYLGEQLEAYAKFFEPKTHENDSMFALYRPIREMTWAFGESSDANFVALSGEHLDLKRFLTHVAVETFVAEYDGLLGAWGMNNFYMYRFEEKTLSTLLPWDKDNTFRAVDFDIWSNVDSNVLMKRALREPVLREAYVDALRRCAQLALRPAEPAGGGEGWLERQIRFMYSQIKGPADADTNKPFDKERFEDDIAKLLEFSRARAAYVLREIERR